MSEKIAKILLVDDHSMVIEGMKAILSQIPNVTVMATASNAFETIEILQKTPEINLVFSDINLPDISGIELCAKIKNEFPTIQVIGLSTFNQRSYVSQMIANGAAGYLVKSAGLEQITEAIESVMAGKMYFSTDISNSNIVNPNNSEEAPTLTRREKEILQLIADGQTNNDIAEKLFVSPYTVDTHRKNLLQKFEVGNTAQLIKMASGFGLV
jgi:DNA-binding NarL/FixJ family response regulator